jgi:hypothetical protein
METKYWGKALWTSLFSIALTYPRKPMINDQFHYKRYFTDLQYVLPCKECKHNYYKKLKQYPIDGALRVGRKGLFKWVLKIHNLVAKELGKKQLNKEEVFTKFFPSIKNTSKTCKSPQQCGGANTNVNGLILPTSLVLTLATLLTTF